MHEESFISRTATESEPHSGWVRRSFLPWVGLLVMTSLTVESDCDDESEPAAARVGPVRCVWASDRAHKGSHWLPLSSGVWRVPPGHLPFAMFLTATVSAAHLYCLGCTVALSRLRRVPPGHPDCHAPHLYGCTASVQPCSMVRAQKSGQIPLLPFFQCPLCFFRNSMEH